MDDEVSIVSTYNLDLLSGYVNGEVGAAVRSESFAARMIEVFLDDMENPENGVLEYEILKDENGRAVLRDGKPVPVFGPEDHLPQEVLDEYASRRRNWGILRATLPYLRPVREHRR